MNSLIIVLFTFSFRQTSGPKLPHVNKFVYKEKYACGQLGKGIIHNSAKKASFWPIVAKESKLERQFLLKF